MNLGQARQGKTLCVLIDLLNCVLVVAAVCSEKEGIDSRTR